MRKQAFISAVILVILPFFGIPDIWKTYVYVIVGLAFLARFVFEEWNRISAFFGQKPNISVESKPEIDTHP